MGEIKRTILINIVSKRLKKSGVPISILSNTLRNIQQATYILGNSRIEREPSGAGPYSSIMKRELELFFVKAEPGSLTAALELSEKEALLFPDYPDFGEKITEDLNNVFFAIKEQNSAIIQKTIPSGEYRKRILNELVPVLPKKQADYEVSFRFGAFPMISRIERPSEDQITKLIGPYEGIKKVKPTEAVITARCLARLKEDGKLDKIINVLNYELFEELDLRPFRTTEIHWLNRKFILLHEIACDVRKEDSLIIIEYEPLKIRAYSFSREEAIKDFEEEFALIWDNYAKEEDANLTSDAIALKKLLLSLVVRVEKI